MGTIKACYECHNGAQQILHTTLLYIELEMSICEPATLCLWGVVTTIKKWLVSKTRSLAGDHFTLVLLARGSHPLKVINLINF